LNVTKVKLNKDQLARELRLPAEAEILAAASIDTELVLFIKHPQAPVAGATSVAPSMSLDDVRSWGES